MREETQVCIVGGGLVGMLCAHQAAEAGFRVFLVDENFSGGGDHAGSVLFQYEVNPTLQELLEAGHQGWAALAETFDDPIGYQTNGVGFVALTPEKAQTLANYAGDGFTFASKPEQMGEMLGVDQVQETLHGVLYEQQGAHIFPTLLHETLRQQLVRKGVRVWGSDRVAEIVMQDGAVKGVKTTHDELVAEHTLLCANAWTAQLMAQLGLKLPLRPARSHRIEMSVTGDMPNFPLVNRLPKGDVLIRPMRSGRFLITYTGLMDQQQATWRQHVDDEMVNLMRQNAAHILPGFSHGKTIHTQTNTLAVTPDNRPYIGRVAAVDGLYVATGMNAEAYAYGPAVANALVALMQKEQPAIDLEPFSPDRYQHLHQQEGGFAEQEAVIRETFADLDTEALEKKITQAKANHEKAKAEAERVVEGNPLKDSQQKVKHAKVDENPK